jgi:hypothetical protein
MRATTVVGWTAAVLAVRAVAWTGEVTVPPDALASAAQVCSVPNLQIPENTPAGITSQLAVPGSGMATNLRVRLGISHTWVGDLIVRLTHAASGVTITLMDQPGVPPGTFGCSGKHVFVVADDSAVGTLESACVSGIRPISSKGATSRTSPWPFSGPCRSPESGSSPSATILLATRGRWSTGASSTRTRFSATDSSPSARSAIRGPWTSMPRRSACGTASARRPDYIAAMTPSANCEHFTSVAPSIKRAKS